jgi:Ribonuclease G/E
MKTSRLFQLSALATAMGFLVSGGAFAADSAEQTVTYEVSAINEITVSGNPGTLTISTATAGSEPDAVSDSSSSYDITTNGSNKKITAAIDTAMPADVTLSLAAASASGTSAGEQTLTATAVDVVTGLTGVAESGQTLTYGLSATVAAGVVASASKTVTLTIADGS